MIKAPFRGLAGEWHQNLTDAAVEEVTGQELRLTDTGRAALGTTLVSGVLKMQGAAIPEASVSQARSNVRVLIGRLQEQAAIRGSNEIDEEMLNAALLDLCPLWPFC